MKEINKKFPTPLGNFTHRLHLASAGLILQIKRKEQVIRTLLHSLAC